MTRGKGGGLWRGPPWTRVGDPTKGEGEFRPTEQNVSQNPVAPSPRLLETGSPAPRPPPLDPDRHPPVAPRNVPHATPLRPTSGSPVTRPGGNVETGRRCSSNASGTPPRNPSPTAPMRTGAPGTCERSVVPASAVSDPSLLQNQFSGQPTS